MPLHGASTSGYAFTGREWDAETGLMFHRARYYAAELGRFLSDDPSGIAGGVNLQQYVSGNPVRFLDPFGLCGQQTRRDPKQETDTEKALRWKEYLDIADVLIQSGAMVFATLIGDPEPALEEALEGGAANVANAARYRAQLSAEEIAGGHAFDKHVVERAEFPGIETRSQFSAQIERIIRNPSDVKVLSNGRTAYWEDSSGTVVIRDPNSLEGGTAFKPTTGKAYFNKLY
jgi:filamentous hemagglutinin